MASERLDTAEKIVRMTEWNESDTWEYTESEGGDESDTLAAAKRFLSAQSFLLAWLEGKVPTGWRRPRRLADFDGKYPSHVLQNVESIIAQRITERNLQQTARINAVLSAARLRNRGNALAGASGDATISATPISTAKPAQLPNTSKSPNPKLSDVLAVKKDFAVFNSQLSDAQSSLRSVANTVAEVTIRLDALTELVNSA